MAKQNVTFIERHVEKFVIGACGATLLTIAFMYLIQSPHTVEMEGQALGPKDFYLQFRKSAEDALAKMKNARPDEEKKGEKEILITRELSPYKAANLPTRLEIAFVPPSPALPTVTPGAGLGKIELAKIIAPAKPVLTSGRSLAILPDMEVVPIGLPTGAALAPNNPKPAQEQGKDSFWITALTTFDRKQQREQFEAAGYEALRQTLNIADVEVERQELLPDGDWGSAALVQPYVPKKMNGPRELHLEQNNEEFIIPDDQTAIVKDFDTKLGTYDKQAELLRPAFQQYLTVEKGEPFEWSRDFPKLIKDNPTFHGVELLEFGVVVPEEITTHRPAPGAATPPVPPKPTGRVAERPAAGGKPSGAAAKTPVAVTPKPPAEDKAAAKDALDKIKEAKKFIADKEYLKAKEVLDRVALNTTAPKPQIDEALKLLEAHDEDFKQAQATLDERLRQREAKKALNMGPDNDLVWINDTTITPGKTYRYRLRLMGVNTYAGLLTLLKNPQDATKMIIPGAWSDWSEPLLAKPDKVMFFTGVVADAKGAKVEINIWEKGDWKKPGSLEVAVGQPIATGTAKNSLTYDGVVVAIDAKKPYRDKKTGQDVDTPVITLVNSRGDVEVRYALQDISDRQKFQRQKTADEKRRKELSDQKPNIGQPPPIGRPPMPGGGLGRPGARDAGNRGS